MVQKNVTFPNKAHSNENVKPVLVASFSMMMENMYGDDEALIWSRWNNVIII